MSQWIDLQALWKIILVGLVCGAGLPALFAVGLKALSFGVHETPDGTGAGTAVATRNPIGLALAAGCFAVVLAAIAWGIYLVVNGT